MRGGDVSAIYAGAMTDATPTPMPPIIRKTTISHTLFARPAPIALMKNNSAAIFITWSRPIRSASRPAVSAPNTQPSSAEATAKPNVALSTWKWS
jgi:hypothetical protein